MIACRTIETGFQKLPSAGEARESLRNKGQFWTPPWLAKVMASWVIGKNPDTVFDPAVGPGTFFSAARQMGFGGRFCGFELHKNTFIDGQKLGLNKNEFSRVVIGDFISFQFDQKYSAIISNPPYVRHHRLSEERKLELRVLSEKNLGFSLDGRVGLHVYFLIKSLEHLSPGGRLAFLLPADVCEGISSKALWNRLCEKYCLEAVLTFAESAAPFPTVDTNAMVFLISNSTPNRKFKWLRINERNTAAILQELNASKNERELAEALSVGFSRPTKSTALRGVPLSHFAQAVRGIATGANEFFFLTQQQVKSLGLDTRFFIRAIGRTRDCRDAVLRPGKLEELDLSGRPTWLLNLDDTPKEKFPATLRTHLEFGEQEKFHQRSLIKSRRPWYKMERRAPPPILFAYLGRRDCRFILNESDVVPLTGFLCVYPWDTSREAVKKLWQALNHPDTLKNLAFAGKSYGNGAIKVEPRQLDTLEIPDSVLQEVGLKSPETAIELALFDKTRKKKISKT